MLERKGNRCFDVITKKEHGCPPINVFQNLGLTPSPPPPPVVTPPAPPAPPVPPIVIPPGGGGNTCCLPTLCPVTCTELAELKACILNYEVIPYVPYGNPILIPDLMTIVGTLSPACQAIYAKLLANYTVVTGGTSFTLYAGTQAVYGNTFSGSTTGCSDITFSVMWGYLDVSPKGKAQVIRSKFCRTPPADVPSFNACADCNTLPVNPCIPVTNVTITAERWQNSLNVWTDFSTIGIWELNTYLTVQFKVVVTNTACDPTKLLYIRAGVNCNNAVTMVAPIGMGIPTANTIFTAKVMWDINCPLTLCPGPYPGNMFNLEVWLPENPTYINFPVNVPLDAC